MFESSDGFVLLNKHVLGVFTIEMAAADALRSRCIGHLFTHQDFTLEMAAAYIDSRCTGYFVIISDYMCFKSIHILKTRSQCCNELLISMNNDETRFTQYTRGATSFEWIRN